LSIYEGPSNLLFTILGTYVIAFDRKLILKGDNMFKSPWHAEAEPGTQYRSSNPY